MDILKFIKKYFTPTLIFLIFSCYNSSRKNIKSEIWIWDWNNKPLPKSISLLSYNKNKSRVYKADHVRTIYDTLNKNKYLIIKFKSEQNRLSTGNKYELKINDTIYYKINDFKTRPINQGGDIDVKVNNEYTEIGDDDILKLNLGFKIKK